MSWDLIARRGTTGWQRRIGLLAGGEALLAALLGALWFGSLGAGAWWLVFGLVAALRVALRESQRRGCALGGAPADGAAAGADAARSWPAASWPGAWERDESGPRGAAGALLRRGAESSGNPGAPRRWAIRRRTIRISRRSCADASPEARPDGSVRGASLPTMWCVHELLDLGEPSDGPGRRAAVRWLGALQGRSGAFAEGCDKRRHSQRVCEHFLVGFFSPAPLEQRLTPVTLPNGKVFRAEPAARFALSALALRALLRAGESSRPPVRRHLESLAQFAEQWRGWGPALTPDAIVAGMHALAEAGPPWSDSAHRLLPVVAGRQGPDGGWKDADLFPMLDMLLAVGTPRPWRWCGGPSGAYRPAALRRELRPTRPAGASPDRTPGRAPCGAGAVTGSLRCNFRA